jgi:fibronectin-binding autotransporter adhesin
MPHRGALLLASIALVVSFALGPVAHAANDIWDNSPGGTWSTAANWTDGTVPSINDGATFNLAQVYNVTLAADPGVIQALAVSAGTVTLQSSGGAKTLSLTAGAGSQDLNVTGASTVLNLGVANNPLQIVAGDDLSIQNGATLAVLFGSDVTVNDFSDNGLNGILRVDGAGSTLKLSGAVSNLIGANAAGSLVFQNTSTDNTINGSLGLANSSTPSVTGSLSILSGSTLALGGNLTLSNQNLTGQAASLTITGANSALTQSGAATVTLGSAANGSASLAIGTTTSGGTFTTGTGLFTINKTGTVTVGSGSNTGSLLLNGNLTINGGVLQKSNAASTLDLAAGKTVNILGGGRLTLAGPHIADTNQVFNLSGASSRFEVTGTNALTIRDGAQVNLTAGTVLSAGGRIDVGVGAVGTGTLTVGGTSTTASGGSELNVWGSAGGNASVTFSDKAVGTFNAGIDLANSSTAGTSAVVNVSTAAALNAGNLNLAASGGTTTSATLNIHGTDSKLLQFAAATLTVGHASEGTAAINVGTTADGGHLTTGSGLFRINKTGTVTIGNGANGGTLEVVGNILVDGGVLQESSAKSMFAWANSKTLTVQNGGRVHFASSLLTATSAQHVVTGANSRLEVVDAIQLRGTAQIGASAGGVISAGQLHVGGNGTAGSLIVDGIGSQANVSGTDNLWGTGGIASVTLSNQASATLAGSLSLAGSANTLVNVISGADLTTGDLSLATLGGTPVASLNISGVGSTVSLTPSSDLVVGHATSGAATILLENGGALSVAAGGTTTVNATGVVHVEIGTADLRALSIVGGTVNVAGGKLVFSTLSVSGGGIVFSSGRIEQTANLTADDSLLTTLLGPTHQLTSGRTLAAASGAANVSSNLDLNGGRLEANSLNLSNAGLIAGQLRIRGGGVAQVTGGATLLAGTSTSVEDGSALVGGGQIVQAGELQLSGTGRIAGSSLANFGLLTGSGRVDANLQNQPTGQVRITADDRLLVRGTAHQNNGLVEVSDAEFEVATGIFTNGTTTSANPTIAARRASLRFSAGLNNAGNIICSEGVCNFFGPITNLASQPTTGQITITANSQATFFDDVVNHGSIQVSAAGLVESTALFLGSLTGNGVGGTGSVFLEGDVEPGANIGTMAFAGDVSIGAGAVVKMELASAQFDRITVGQSLALGGALALSLSPGFSPVAGQSFDLFDWGTRSGGFASIQLPAVTGLFWDTSLLYQSGVVKLSAAIPGDFNSDGRVDAADYTVWRDGLGQKYVQSDYAVWKSHFGQSGGAGGGMLAGASLIAPEPTTLWQLFLAAILSVANCRQRECQAFS